MKVLTIAVAICICILVMAVPVSAASWTYTSSNVSSPWTCPAGVTNVTLEIVGGGGSGRGGQSALYAGGGGFAGQHFTYSKISVIPGTAYTISVGAGGTTSSYNGVSYPGGSTSGFTKLATGGAGGAILGTNGNGGAGEQGFVVGTRIAVNGTGSDGRLGGTSGLGYGAGAGGGSHDSSPAYDTTGGAGASGLMIITDFADYTGNVPAFVADDTELPYGSVVHFTDQSTITESTDLAYHWDFGDGETSNTTGDVNHVYAYMGSFDVSLTISSRDGDIVELKPSYINVISPEQIQTPYFPSSITFTVVTSPYGRGVSGARVNATYVTSTFPDAVAYLMNMYKIDRSIATQMLSTSTTMTGLTGGDGSISFSMHPSLQYNITVTSSSGNIVTAVYPKESTYTIWLPDTESNVENLYEQINATLTITEPNTSYATLGTRYQDHAGRTTALLFYVNTSNGTPVYSTSVNPGTSLQTLTHTIQNVRGAAYYWGIRGTRTGGNVSLDQGVTMKGPSGVLVDLHLPDVNYYQWIAVFLLFLLSSMASKSYVRFFAIIIPLMGMMFWWFGWLPGTLMVAILPFCLFLGVIYYMKGSLMENYGTGGSGSMLMNIVVFLIIFQLMIGFTSSLGVFNHQSIVTPKNQFSNIDLTDIQQNASQIGGVNDPLQSAGAITTSGFAAVKVLMSMLEAVFICGLFLSEMFPSVPVEFIAILQVGIYVMYALFLIKLFFHSGSETDL